MTETVDISAFDVYILAGGRGTRIKNVLGNTPKIIAPVRGVPFLSILLDRLYLVGIRRVVLGLGVGHQHVEDFLHKYEQNDLIIEKVIETSPLGTAGAIRFAAPKFRSESVFVMNGDTICDVNLPGMLSAHINADAYITIACSTVMSGTRFGTILLRNDGFIDSFVEKKASAHPCIVNAGIYLLSQRAVSDLCKSNSVSFEYDVLRHLAGKNILPFFTDGPFIDFGTPEDYNRVL